MRVYLKWRPEQIRDLIAEREARGGDFYYLSAELSAFHDGRDMGIDPRKISQYKKECMNETYNQLDIASVHHSPGIQHISIHTPAWGVTSSAS